jgi:hypothetical protein
MLDESDQSRARQGDYMVDLQSVEIELQNARKARINAELACCDVEQLAAEIRRSHRTISARSSGEADAGSAVLLWLC